MTWQHWGQAISIPGMDLVLLEFPVSVPEGFTTNGNVQYWNYYVEKIYWSQ